jgi:serine-type D-Ala-D-Ala carboxypeptidase (penicillin-binding protein 5/6)
VSNKIAIEIKQFPCQSIFIFDFLFKNCKFTSLLTIVWKAMLHRELTSVFSYGIRLGAIVICLWVRQLSAEKLAVQIDSEAAILINADTGAILFEKNAHSINFPASITKVATTLYALKLKGDQLDAKVVAEQEAIASISSEAKKRSNYTTPSYWVEQASTHMGIKKGEEFTFKDLLFGVMVVSANDASNVVAQFAAGTIPNFVTGLNEYVKTLGCKDTHFTNPHGLHHPKHQTTPYDMAIITKEALKNPLFCEMAAAPRYIRPKTNKQEPTVMLQKNRLLRSGRFHYPKAIGVKTGYTSIARHTLIAAAQLDGRSLIAVLMKAEEASYVYQDAIKLFDAAFNQNKVKKTVLKAGLQKFASQVEGGDKPVETYLKEDLVLEFYPAEEPPVKCFLQWNNLALPIEKDRQVAEISLKNPQGEVLYKLPLFANDNVDQTWTFWMKNFL